jgi:hypothetical protein
MIPGALDTVSRVSCATLIFSPVVELYKPEGVFEVWIMYMHPVGCVNQLPESDSFDWIMPRFRHDHDVWQ